MTFTKVCPQLLLTLAFVVVLVGGAMHVSPSAAPQGGALGKADFCLYRVAAAGMFDFLLPTNQFQLTSPDPRTHTRAGTPGVSLKNMHGYFVVDESMDWRRIHLPLSALETMGIALVMRGDRQLLGQAITAAYCGHDGIIAQSLQKVSAASLDPGSFIVLLIEGYPSAFVGCLLFF